jgi:hypothetical protein
VIAAHEVGRLVSWSQHGVASGVRVEGYERGISPARRQSKVTRARVVRLGRAREGVRK